MDYQVAKLNPISASAAQSPASRSGRQAGPMAGSLKLVMLARNPRLYSHRRIIEAAEARNHTIDVVNTLHVHMTITSSRPTLMVDGRTLPRYDAVIPRIGASITHYGLAVLRQFEMQGVFPLNESVAIGRSRDKLRALQLLAREGIGLPVTAFAHGPRRAEDVIKAVGGTPCVIKLLEGTQGRGVILAETAASAKSIIEAFSAANTNILVQEYIKEAEGTDIRALVVDGKVVASMKRTCSTGEFRANLHRGGKAGPVVLTEEERRIALRAAEALGLNVAGVDMLRSHRGPLVMEVNSSPGIEGMEKASGADLAGAMLDFLERHAGCGETRTRGVG
jgi:ribosomal protein S6--L-glutamate ligase